MIVKIITASGSDFHGVQYNDKKVEKGTGELMLMKNFPSFINGESSQEEVRDYLKSISKNEKVKKPQFHAVISAKFQTAQQRRTGRKLRKISCRKWATENNRSSWFTIAIPKTTTSISFPRGLINQTGKKINDSYEKLESPKSTVNDKRKTIRNKFRRKIKNC
jgi:hypothetical protein